MQCDVFYVVCVFSTSFVNLLQTNGRLTDIVRSFQTLMPSLHLLGKVGSHVTPPPVGEQSIAMSVSVSVCLSLSVEHISKTRCSNFTKFRRVLSVTVVVCSDGVAINQSINQSVQCVMYFGCRGIRHFVPEIGQVKAAVAARILKVTHQGAAPVRRQSWCLRLPCRWNVSYVGLENSSNAVCWHRVAVWSYTGL